MNGPALLALQQIDHELDQLAAQAKRLPSRAAVAAAEEAHRAWAAQRAAHVAVGDRAGEAIARAEHDGAQLDAKRANLEAKLKTVIAPREAEALMNEIATVKAQHDAIDDLELAAMEEQAEAEGAIDVLDGQEPALQAALADARAALDAELAGVSVEMDAWRAKRVEAMAALSADELSFEYRDIVDLCVEPLAVAEVSARLRLQLGVAQVLLRDLTRSGHVTTFEPGVGLTDDVHTILRVIDGLRQLS